MSSAPLEKIAKILRTDKHRLVNLEMRMAEVTGKSNVFEKIVDENEKLMSDRMQILGIPRDSAAKEIYDGLISKIDFDDSRIFELLGKPVCHSKEDCGGVAGAALRVAGNPKGFFLKIDKAREFLLNEPPRETMKFLGYDSAEKMLDSEDLLEIYASLRFVEDSNWLNYSFFKQYENLKPEDFEEREVKIIVLDYKWAKSAAQFIAKKKHNISHLKELGAIFVIPVMLDISGEVLRMFVLIMHYLNEIPFYSDIARKISKEEKFAANYISILRGDVPNDAFPESKQLPWLVVQRYLSKDDDNDWRLFVPHINPEAMHWEKAEKSLPKLSEINPVRSSRGVLNSALTARLKYSSTGQAASYSASNGINPAISNELSFWGNLDWVGDYFRDESGVEILVSFNLVDTVMSLVKEKEMVKYLYHHQEALWNKIFIEYMGEDGLEKYARDYLLKGYFEV